VGSRSLGKVFQDSLEHGNPDSLRDPNRPPRRPPIFCTIGAAGSALVGVGWALLFLLVLAPGGSSNQATAAGVSIIAGGALLLVGWLALLGTGNGGMQAILASAAAPLAVWYFRANVDDVFYRETTIAYVGLGFATFAGGHLVAFGVPTRVRAAAAIALAFIVLAFSAEAANWQLGRGTLSFLYMAAFGALTATCFLVSSHLLGLGRAMRSAR
jgi:hypothetical protein